MYLTTGALTLLSNPHLTSTTNHITSPTSG